MREKITPSKKRFNEMKVGDLLMFNQFEMKMRRRIQDIVNEAAIVNIQGYEVPILRHNFIRFERRSQ